MQDKRVKIKIYSLIGFVFLSLLCKSFKEEFYFLDFIYFVVCFVFAFSLTEKIVVPQINRIFLIFLVSLFAYYWLSGISPRDWMNGSHNQVNIILLCYFCIYSIISSIYENKYPYILSIVIFVLTCFTSSRAGVISTSFLMISIPLLTVLRSRHNLRSYILPVFSIIVLLALITSYSLLNEFGNRFQDERFESIGRMEVLYYYYDSLSFRTIISGVDLNWFYDNYLLSSHNSYLAWHSHFGLGSIFLIVLCIATAKKLYRVNIQIFCVFCTLLLRGVTDEIFFTTNFDGGLAFFSCVFYAYRKNR